jgi:hypothetical protein
MATKLEFMGEAEWLISSPSPPSSPALERHAPKVAIELARRGSPATYGPARQSGSTPQVSGNLRGLKHGWQRGGAWKGSLRGLRDRDAIAFFFWSWITAQND